MKNKSKRIFFAAIALRALLLIIPVSALAAAEEEQEIGVPQAIEAPVKGCAAAVLLPDDGRIYSVYEGVLTWYAINPFKKIGSIAIDWGQLKDKLDEKRCSVGITNDKSKFILVYDVKILLLDARTGQVLNRVDRKDGYFGSAILNDNELVTLDLIREGPGESGSALFFNLTIRDADTLKLKKEIRDLGKSSGFFLDRYLSPRMSKNADRIYMAMNQSLVVLNSKTYAPELSLFRSDHDEAVDGSKISMSFQKLALRGVSKVTDHLTGKTANYDDVSRDRILIFDQATREFHQETKEFNRREYVEQISGEEYRGFVGQNLHISRGKEYLMSPAGPSIGALLINLSTGVGIIFKQYASGEAILTERLISGGPWYFQLTPGARKYLMMKNSAGKIVPINDATFAKYRRTESSH